VGEWFEKYPNLRSSAFLVAQYFADNAWDEVHTRLVFSELETPDLNAALTRNFEDKEDRINLTTHADLNYRYSHALVAENFTTNIELEDELAIPMLAAFCREDVHQDQDLVDRYSLCATMRRQENANVGIEIAPMLRPWLDGVALHSQWDDAANLGTSDPSEDQFAPRWMIEQREAPTRRHGSTEPS
jgi:hypothetical protein